VIVAFQVMTHDPAAELRYISLDVYIYPGTLRLPQEVVSICAKWICEVTLPILAFKGKESTVTFFQVSSRF
jgi:hypothetical protein